MSEERDVIVVGAGIAGLYALHSLRQRGFSVRLLEAGNGVGGTWYWNTYPGCRVDVESFEYSYSFSDDLQQEWEWTERWPGQPEIQRYLNHVTDRFALREDIQLGARVVGAEWGDTESRWTVTTDSGQRYRAQHLVMASGAVSSLKNPHDDFAGVDDFRGETYLSARFPAEGVDFLGKRVAIIGTGASGVQLIPEIAREAAHLTVLQRTPAFTLPANNYPLTQDAQRSMKARYPEHRAAARVAAFGVPGDVPDRGVFDDDPERVLQRLEERWQAGGISPFMTLYTDVLTNEAANEVVAEFIRGKIRSIVDDPAVAERLSPRTYPFGTKRPTAGYDYYETYNRDNVSLVSVKDNPIDRITKSGIRLADGKEIDCDIIVFAIGFDAMTGALLDIDPVGRDGVRLGEVWSEGATAYLGLFTAGFPNIYFLNGPGSVSVLANNYTTIEQHVEWVTDLITNMRETGRDSVETTVEAQETWMQHVADVASATLFDRADSWYVGANVTGKPRRLMLYLAGLGVYRSICNDVASKDYEGLTFRTAAALAR